MNILLIVHSILRWFIIVMAALTVFKFAISWASNSSFKGMDRGLASGLSGMIDLQVLLGLIFFLWNGFTSAGFPGYRWLHLFIMLVAAALAHIPSRLKALSDKLRFQYSIFAILGALALIFVGVAVVVAGK
jgi:uncharacterized membrane protein YfhO